MNETNTLLSKIASSCMNIGGRLSFAIVIWVAGRIIIRHLIRMLTRSRTLARTDDTLRSFSLSFLNIGLNAGLLVSVISILGVPIASIVTVLVSAGVAVGLALQGALSNLAGGIMIMLFTPFKVGDYVEAAGAEGRIVEVSLFYTVFITLDNRRVFLPNGSLMNAKLTNFSVEGRRRLDLSFPCAKTEDPARVQELILDVLNQHPLVLKEPAPLARLFKNQNDSMEFTAQVWCLVENYWAVYYDITEGVTEALISHGVQAPAMRIVTDTQGREA